MERKRYWAATIVTFVIVCRSIPTSSSAAATSSTNTRKEQEAYLRRFAYMGSSSPDPRIGELTNPEEIFRMAVKKFQMMAGLSATGTVDKDTQKMMEMPRCGVADEVGMGLAARKRRRRYAAQGSKWPNAHLTYRINNFTPDLLNAKITSEIKAAFKYWSDVSPLRFTEYTTRSIKVDIDINFTRGDHGDGSSFDGEGKTLAHAFFPQYGGDAHFDEDEDWTAESFSGTNLLQVAIHEFGHSLGLSHSDDQDAIMAPFYRGYIPNLKLHSDDIAGIRYIYGGNAGSVSTTQTTSATRRPYPTNPATRRPYPYPTNPATRRPYPTYPVTRGSTATPRPPPPKDICRDPTVDAFFAAGLNFYLFKRDKYYKLDYRGILPGYPRQITDDWLGLPNNIDTAFHCSGFIYFFKDDKVWSYSLTSRQLQSSYPQYISTKFYGIPSKLDAAFIWSGNNKLFFIKDDQYYRVSNHRYSQSSRVDPGYPSKLNYWKGLPAKIDAAFNLGNSRTYFFSGKDYYRFNDVEFKVDKGYPVSTAKLWLNCPDDSRHDMMEDEWMKGKDQFSTSSGVRLSTTLQLPTQLFALLTIYTSFLFCPSAF